MQSTATDSRYRTVVSARHGLHPKLGHRGHWADPNAPVRCNGWRKLLEDFGIKLSSVAYDITGVFNEHHAFLARVHLDLIDRHTEAIEELTNRIEVMIQAFD